MKYTVTITPAEDAALSYAALSQQDWIDNSVHERARLATDEIVGITVTKCLEAGIQIPNAKDEMVTLAFAQGWVKTAAERQVEVERQAEVEAAAQASREPN